ncbi:LOW QUALITY PROTEIN: lebercilin-like protein [Micropterus salmoides]|uniref:LOW QUALITY PROTEIN: lebercilin-like protein n=1 Tax=Micropterus salmoides TaxID=27706 RepID=UPI0018EA4E6E|nr:LOW QUALITY PROTEIN: lebercilin-like protein [Micropterus salmoides]
MQQAFAHEEEGDETTRGPQAEDKLHCKSPSPEVASDQDPAGFKADEPVCQLELHPGAQEPSVCLQQQLNEARTENKLLKRIQHRHTVALQHFQDSEGSLSQILTKHNNEAPSLQGLLRETQACLARQLQATESKLQRSKDSLQHLQLLSQDQGLLEREELNLRLTNATEQLDQKDKRILVWRSRRVGDT